MYNEQIQLTIDNTDIKDLFRAYFSDKEYLVFNIAVFNSGSVIRLHCTNDFTKYQYIGNDGYSFIIDNDFDINDMIKKSLLKYLNNISRSWLKECYYHTFEDHLKSYKISQYNYDRLLKIES